MNALFLALTVLVAAGFAGTQVPEQRTGRLTIDAVAIDGRGNPVTDLRQEEVEVWIGGYRVPIQAFQAVTPGSGQDDGRLIVLLMDDIFLPPQLVPRAREAARRFVTRMGPDDEMVIVPLDGAATESTPDRARLLRAIDTYNTRPSTVMTLDRIGEHVLTTVDTLARRLAEAPTRRCAIVAIGVSWVFDRPIPSPALARDLRPEWTAAMRSLARARASLYVIEPAGVGMAPAGAGSEGFAHETGGHAFVNTNDLAGVADRIMRETANYYLIAVEDPPIQRKADLRELEVRVRRRGVTVRARSSIPGH